MSVRPVDQASPDPHADWPDAAWSRADRDGFFGRFPPALSLILDTALIALVISAVAVWPAVAACRSTAQTYGFIAGDSLTTCIRRGVKQRVARAEHRLQVMLREAGL